MPQPTHITERSPWDAARETGTYETPTRGRTLQEEGFIHCSTRAQLPRAAAFLCGPHEGPDDLAVLVIDPERLGVPVRHQARSRAARSFPTSTGR